MENIDKAAEMSFHGIDYIIKISTRDDVLYIEIEQKDSGNIWKNSFTANYIEEISQKTGNFKKFPVFVKMLLSSVIKSSDAVFLDILTYQDLEMLKARKQKANTSMTTNPEKMKNNKRYMILTYSVEYDKVHYPLPLNFEENPDVEVLKNTIRRLRMEMDELKTAQVKTTQSGEGFFMTQEGGDAQKNSELLLLKVENETLKEKMKKFEDNSLNTTKKMGAVQHDLELKSKLEVETELETLKKDYVRDIKRMKAKLEETEIQLEKTKEELSRAGPSANGLDGSGRKLTKDEEIEFAHSKKMAAKYQAENEKLGQELEDFKNLDRKQKARIKQLETELESALKRATYSRGSNQSGGSPYSRSRGNSPGNSATKRYTSTPTNYSPGFKAADNKKTTPVRGRTGITTPSPKATPKGTPTRSTGSATRTYQYGTSRDRNSPLNKNATAPGPLNKRTTPQRTNVTNPRDNYGTNKRSPQPMRNLSPSNTKPNTYSPSNAKLSPGNRFGMRVNNYVSGGNLQRKDLDNSLRNRSKNSNMTDSGDEMSRPKRDLSNRGQGLNTMLSSNRNAASSYNNNINSIQQKLKENIHDFKESKSSNKPAQPVPEASTEINDIGDRLNKLQDLLKRAKS